MKTFAQLLSLNGVELVIRLDAIQISMKWLCFGCFIVFILATINCEVPLRVLCQRCNWLLSLEYM